MRYNLWVRLVLDTSVLIAAIRGPGGASARLLDAALAEEVHVLISTPLLLEYEAVMTRPEHQLVSGLSDEEVGKLLDAFAAIAEHVEFFFTWKPSLNDPDDEMVMETAVSGGATAIVTFNKRHFQVPAARFGIEIIDPKTAYRRLKDEAK
jgi:putative PIN family toxin of toxin-antitoxin system